MDGLLLLDKPVGASSFQALYPVKRVFRGRKIGHAGTLDPAASGLLVVGVGAGTRLLEFLEGLPKRYRFALRLGVATDTYDLEGRILEERDASQVAREDVEAALPRFRGEFEQLPPAYSAVKIRGKRACDRARAGETVTLSPRRVRVDRLEITGFERGTVTLEMDCSKGTYVRAVAHDLGQVLGCGAAAHSIRRLAVGLFRVEDAVAPDALKGREDLLSLDKAVGHLPAVRLRSVSWADALLHGNPVPAAGYAPVSTLTPSIPPATGGGMGGVGVETAVFSPDGELMAIGAVNPLGQLHPRKVLRTSP